MLADDTKLSVWTYASHFPSLLQAGSMYDTAAVGSTSSGTGANPRTNAWSMFTWAQISPVLSKPNTWLPATNAIQFYSLALEALPAPRVLPPIKLGENFALISGSPIVIGSYAPRRRACPFTGTRQAGSIQFATTRSN